MAIIATSNGGATYSIIEAGNYVARCFQMIHIGTSEQTFLGETKTMNKVRLSWELPTELKRWKEDEPEKPSVISKEFTLSLHEKATLRAFLKSWRGKDFTEDQAKAFDITVLVGIPCMLNVIHKQSKDGSKTYPEIGSVSPLPKGLACPEQVNPSTCLSYDSFDWSLYESLPDFLKDKIKVTDEFRAINEPHATDVSNTADGDDLPF